MGFSQLCANPTKKRRGRILRKSFGEEEQGELSLSLPPLSHVQLWLFAMLVSSYGASMIFLACFHF